MSNLKTIVFLALGSWLIYLAFMAPSMATWDGGGMLRVAISIVTKHDLTVEAAYGMLGRGGKYYAIWYPLLSFIAIPFAAVGLFVAHQVHLPEIYVVQVFALLLSTIIATFNVAATYWLAKRLGAAGRSAILAAVAYGFCTVAFTMSRTFYADPLLAFFVTIGIGLALREVRGAGLASCCGLAILAKPTGIVLGITIVVYFLANRRYRELWSPALGMIVATLLYMAYDFARFGNVFTNGQPAKFWDPSHAPLWFLGLLISPGVGILIYCPIVLLALGRRINLVLGTALLFVLVYSAWARWYSSDWGPRFLIPVLPALVALSVLSRRRKVWLALAVLGLIIQLPTLVASPERYANLKAERGYSEPASVWNPIRAPILGMWGSAVAQIRDASGTDLRLFTTYHPPANRMVDSRNYRIVALWWWMLPLLHISRWVGVFAAVLMTGCGFVSIYTAFRNASEETPTRYFQTVSPMTLSEPSSIGTA